MFFTLSAHADALSIPHQIATQIGMGIPRFFVKKPKPISLLGF
jgi:hypothetical protein